MPPAIFNPLKLPILAIKSSFLQGAEFQCKSGPQLLQLSFLTLRIKTVPKKKTSQTSKKATNIKITGNGGKKCNLFDYEK